MDRWKGSEYSRKLLESSVTELQFATVVKLEILIFYSNYDCMKIVVPVDDSVNKRDDSLAIRNFGPKHNLVNSDEGLARI